MIARIFLTYEDAKKAFSSRWVPDQATKHFSDLSIRLDGKVIERYMVASKQWHKFQGLEFEFVSFDEARSFDKTFVEFINTRVRTR